MMTTTITILYRVGPKNSTTFDCENFGSKCRTAMCRIPNCSILCGEQDCYKINNLAVSFVKYKRVDVKWHNSCQHAVHVTGLLTCTFTYRSLSTRKTGQRIVSTAIQLTFQRGVFCNRSCIVRSSETLII